jgi:hypothetical protein
MALNKLKFNSINVTPAANQALKFNSSANGFETGSAGGSITFIKKLTASSSSTISFVDGSSNVVLDDTYKEYLFTFKNMHPSSDTTDLDFQVSTDGGSSYGVTATTTFFTAEHNESGSFSLLGYSSARDLAQDTGFQALCIDTGNQNDESCSGFLHLFNPSNTTFVKHFISRVNSYHGNDESIEGLGAGYFNTTSAIDAVQFKFDNGNIDAGDICLYGIN